MAIYLGLDIGTSGTKALLMNDKGKVLATATCEYPVYSPRPAWSEQDPEYWWQACVEGTRQVMRAAKIKAADIAGVGLSGQMHGSVFLDKSGKVIRRALLWNDQRTITEANDIEQRLGGRKKLLAAANNLAMTGFTAPKILWLRNNEPKKYERLHTILLPKDYIRYRLTGELATEVSDASGTLLLDIKRRTWSDKMLSALEIDPDLLPPCYESHKITGQVTQSVAKETGLKAGTPVVGGAGDQPAGAIGNGIVASGVVSCTMGTSGVFFAHSPTMVPNDQGLVQSFCHAVDGQYCIFACMMSAGGALQWLRDTLWDDQVAALRSKGKDPGQLYPKLLAMAQDVGIGAEGLVFLPYLTGERCPYLDPQARGAWIGLTTRHRREHMVRSVVEAITFGMRDQLEVFLSLGIKVNEIRASGGGARSQWWRQVMADAFRKRITTINATEGGALGVAILAAVGTGAYDSVQQACTAIIHNTDEVKPRAAQAKKYDPVYEQYRSLYPKLKDDFHYLSRSFC